VTPVESRVLRTEGENAAAPAISRTRDVNGLSLRKSREGGNETQGEPLNGSPWEHRSRTFAMQVLY